MKKLSSAILAEEFFLQTIKEPREIFITKKMIDGIQIGEDKTMKRPDDIDTSLTINTND